MLDEMRINDEQLDASDIRQLESADEIAHFFAKLRVAEEKLAVAKEKGKEVYKPAKEVTRPLATIDKGDVYLENDKRERKATGSYYTPDYIVTYIVRHTVGSVLDRKFAALEKRLRDAQRDYRKYAKLVEARRKSTGRDESAAVYWNNREMQNLVDDCLNVRVLDPAMGSGHFLVEVVDYVSNRLIDFLNGWSENPVWAFLEQTRDDILNDMERQKVTIDVDRLTRVALLKRAVLKRCVYGVDLNAMAVELAKVSLWLDAFTLGAPLSFLDHHLKHGNSLIGSRVADVQKALEGDLSLFSRNKFAGVMLATDLMRQVSYFSDNTVEQMRQSAQAYRDARDHLAPYKRVLDVYTSRWFGNTPSKSKKGTTFDPTIEFLRRNDTQAWLEDPYNPNNRLPDDGYIKTGLVAQRALCAAEEKCFFHWELEFPEVFFAPSKPGGQDVQLNPNGGFDAVVGNPPWGAGISVNEQVHHQDVYIASAATMDSFALFSEQSLHNLIPEGLLGYVIPSGWQTGKSYTALRKLLVEKSKFCEIINLPYDVFPSAYVDSMILIAAKLNVEETFFANNYIKLLTFDRHEKISHIHENDKRFICVDYSKWFAEEIDPENEHMLLSYLTAKQLELFSKVIHNSHGLGKITDIQRDITPFKLSNDIHGNTFVPGLDGELLRYHYEFSGKKYVKYDPNIAEYKPERYFKGTRIILRELISRQFRLQAAYVEEDFITNKSHQSILISDESYSLKFVIAILNSGLLSYFHVRSSAIALRGDFPKIVLAETRRLPIPHINFTTPADERARLMQQAIGAYDLGDHAGILRRVQAHIDSDKTDVVHDILAHLAQVMIDLNKRKQAEVKRFLEWLEKRLKIRLIKDGVGSIDSLTGKTILQGYLGDYQKGEDELSWREFYYRLYQNRSRFAVSLSDVEGEIQREYEKSLETLMPIKHDLARTDALIDKIVYRLYGLTDEEIELIERPQYEQALRDAKAQVAENKDIKDDEEKIEKIAAGILPAARRFFERVEPKSVEEMLDNELPAWRSLPPEAPTFLLTGDYNLRTLPDHMDFSASVIPYTKAVEVVLSQRIFIPFRQQYTDADCRNDFLKKFMRGEKDLTLGSFMIILSSSQETALRHFISHTIPDAPNRVFGTHGLVTLLNNDALRDIRNKAAHDEVLSRDEAQEARVWAMQILRQV